MKAGIEGQVESGRGRVFLKPRKAITYVPGELTQEPLCFRGRGKRGTCIVTNTLCGQDPLPIKTIEN